MPTPTKLQNLIIEYEELLSLKDKLADETKENNKAIERMKEVITDQLLEEDKDHESYCGYTYSIQPKSEWRFLREELLIPALKENGYADKFEAMRENGFGDFVSSSVNTRGLSNAINAELDAGKDVPDEFAALLTKWEHNDLGRKKTSATRQKTLEEAKNIKANKGV